MEQKDFVIEYTAAYCIKYVIFSRSRPYSIRIYYYSIGAFLVRNEKKAKTQNRWENRSFTRRRLTRLSFKKLEFTCRYFS